MSTTGFAFDLNDVNKLATVEEHEDELLKQNSKHFHQNRHSYTGQKPVVIPVQKLHVVTPKPRQLNGHVHAQPVHVEEAESTQESRRSTTVEDKVNITPSYRHFSLNNHQNNHVKHGNESRRSTLVSESPIHHEHFEQIKSPQESRRSTVVEQKRIPSYRHYHLNHQQQNHVKHGHESRRSTLISEAPINHRQVEHFKSPQESRRPTIVEDEHHESQDINNNKLAADHVPVAKLCSIFEKNYKVHQKVKTKIKLNE